MTAASLPPLPALNSLGDLSNALPTIAVDSREQTPLVFNRLPSRAGTLSSGDYSIAGLETLFAVERKTIADLVQCIGPERERFERELCRLRGYRFRRLLIVGSREDVEQGRYRSNIKPQSVLGSLDVWEVRYGVPYTFASTPEEAARVVERWAYLFAREICQEANALLRGCQQPKTEEITHARPDAAQKRPP
jgi:DNA excision repair protein ERCC-4